MLVHIGMNDKININKILALPCNKACSIRGADMGRRSQRDGQPERLHLQRLYLHGDYDAGGAYWGYTPGTAIYCAFSPETTENDIPIRVFVRAQSRKEAKEKILAELAEGFSFLR